MKREAKKWMKREKKNGEEKRIAPSISAAHKRCGFCWKEAKSFWSSRNHHSATPNRAGRKWKIHWTCLELSVVAGDVMMMVWCSYFFQPLSANGLFIFRLSSANTHNINYHMKSDQRAASTFSYVFMILLLLLPWLRHCRASVTLSYGIGHCGFL